MEIGTPEYDASLKDAADELCAAMRRIESFTADWIAAGKTHVNTDAEASFIVDVCTVAQELTGQVERLQAMATEQADASGPSEYPLFVLPE